MFHNIDDLFDLNGDGELDGLEMAMAYTVLFGSDESREAGICGFEDGFDDWDA